jgi:hypothetical protein
VALLSCGDYRAVEAGQVTADFLGMPNHREVFMEKYLFVGLTNPVEGQEDAFNAWYSDVHLKDVLKVPGIVAAQRFKLGDVQRDQPPFPWRYLALYEIKTDDLNHTLAALRERAGTSAMAISGAVAPDRVGWFFQPITSKLEG